MRELITMISSLIIILCCLSSFLVTEEPEASHGVPERISSLNGGTLHSQKVGEKSRLFKKVQSVEIKNGVLIFVTLQDEGGLREHYFQIRNKNIILCNHGDATMPHNSIKFEMDDSNTTVVTIPPAYEVDYIEAMTSL